MQNKEYIETIAMYLRLSKDDINKEESESITNQRKIIKKYIEEHFIYKQCLEYVDDGYTGTNFDRPAFKEMIKDIENKNIKLVITKNLARFARDYIDSGEYIERIFPNNRVRFIAIMDNVDNFEESVSNEFMPIKGVFNEVHCRDTSKAVKKSKRKKMHEGFYACTTPPYGYKKSETVEGKLEIDDEAAVIVRMIFQMKASGKTQSEITEYLNMSNIKTPIDYLNVKGLEKVKNKNIWRRSTVNRILSNKTYLGHTIRGGTQSISYKGKNRLYIRREDRIITYNTHEPVVPQELFDRVHTSKYGAHMSVSNINVILKDLVYCDNCGAKMIIKKVREKYIIYCPKNAESKELCSNSTKMYYHKIENEALKKIVDYYNSHININVFKDKLLKKYIQNKVDGLEKYKKQLQKQLASVNFKISQIYNERLSEEIDNEQYKKVYTELTNERRQIDNDLTAVDEKIFGYTHKEERSIEKNKQEIYKIIDKIAEKKYSRDDIIKLIRRIRIDNNKIIFDYNFSNY